MAASSANTTPQQSLLSQVAFLVWPVVLAVEQLLIYPQKERLNIPSIKNNNTKSNHKSPDTKLRNR
jgi:hypothetical protein